MGKNPLTPMERVAELVTRHGNYRAAAKACGISLAHLNKIGLGKVEVPTPEMLRRLGLEIPTQFWRAGP